MTNLVADYSYLQALQTCRRKFYYGAERSLSSAEIVPVLHAGTALHDGLEALYKSDWSVASATDALRASWGDYRVPETHKHSYLGPNHLAPILGAYARHYEDEPRQIVKTSDELFGERTFVLDWDGVTVGGRIDLVQSDEDGRTFLVDFKTTTGWLNSYWASQKALEIDHQLRIYWAAVEHELDIRLAGAYISGVYMGENAADPDEAWERRKSSRFRLFGPYTFSPAKIEETRDWIEAGLEEIRWRRSLPDGERSWPQNTNNRYGCNKCEFYDLCRSSPKVREGIIRSRYEEVELNGRLASGADHDPLKDEAEELVHA